MTRHLKEFCMNKCSIPTSNRRLSAKLVLTFADRGCHVGSVMDPYGRYSRLSRTEPLLFLSNSSSIVFMRLSGHRSRHTSSQKMC
jgi:hypothetical protein